MNRSNQSYLFGSYPTPISSLHYSNITFTVLHPLHPLRTINTTTPPTGTHHSPLTSFFPFLSFPFSLFPLQYNPGTIRYLTTFLYFSQSAPYFLAHFSSSLRSRWIRSTAKYTM